MINYNLFKAMDKSFEESKCNKHSMYDSNGNNAQLFKDSCPYCEIDQLKAELEEARVLNDEYKIIIDAQTRQKERYENIYRRYFEAKQQLKAAEAEVAELDDSLYEAKRQLKEANKTISEGIANCTDCENGFVCRENEQLKSQLEEAVKMLSEQDFEYNRKTNALIERHDNKLAEVTAKYNDVCTIERVDLLKQQLAEARTEVEKYKETVPNMELLLCRPKSCKARQEAARECVEVCKKYFGDKACTGDYAAQHIAERIRQRYELEG